jgi:hydrogenase maturation protease
MTGAPRGAVVACIGNGLVADDAAGGAVFDYLSTCGVPQSVRLIQLGTGGLVLLDCLEGEPTLVVVDAVQLGAVPGTVHVLEWDDVPVSRGAAVSAHGIGVREAIEVGRRLFPELMPSRVVLVGIEGACFDQLGWPMTPSVVAAIPLAAQAVLDQLTRASAQVCTCP